VLSRKIYVYQDTLLSMQLFFHPRFTTACDSRHVWMLLKGYINRMCGKTPTDLRMGIHPAPVTYFVGLSVTLNETQREAAINVA
jgi:hypothetical protein